MKMIILFGVAFLTSCTPYVASNQYMAYKIKRSQSINVKFDLLLDDDISIDDPRIKSIIYASSRQSHIVITYANPNAEQLANKIAMIFSDKNLIVLKPQLINAMQGQNLNKYVVVYIKYE